MSNLAPLASMGRPAEVLLVEDNEHDYTLTLEAFKRSRLAMKLTRVSDGEQCMAYLRKEGAYAAALTPDLILLDLNMPRMDGREVMSEIATDPVLRLVPVVILTTSAADKEILAMYDLHCSSYIIKPINFTQFVDTVRAITEYWLMVVVVPSAMRA